jgi:hypothetical protein
MSFQSVIAPSVPDTLVTHVDIVPIGSAEEELRAISG